MCGWMCGRWRERERIAGIGDASQPSNSHKRCIPQGFSNTWQIEKGTFWWATNCRGLVWGLCVLVKYIKHLPASWFALEPQVVQAVQSGHGVCWNCQRWCHQCLCGVLKNALFVKLPAAATEQNFLEDADFADDPSDCICIKCGHGVVNDPHSKAGVRENNLVKESTWKTQLATFEANKIKKQKTFDPAVTHKDIKNRPRLACKKRGPRVSRQSARRCRWDCWSRAVPPSSSVSTLKLGKGVRGRWMEGAPGCEICRCESAPLWCSLCG